MGTLFGPLVGVALLTYLPLVSQSFANYSMLATGVLLVLFLRYLPAGIWGAVLEGVDRARAGWPGCGLRGPGRARRAGRLPRLPSRLRARPARSPHARPAAPTARVPLARSPPPGIRRPRRGPR